MVELDAEQGRWLRLGVILSFLHYIFLFLVLLLLQVDFYIALGVSLVLSGTGAIALFWYVMHRM